MRTKARIRGRPPRKGHSAVDTKILEHLTKISLRHWVDPNRFFNKIVDAWKNRKSTCKQLTIQCREKTRDQAVFLITTNHKVVAQFPIPEHLLKMETPPKEFAYMIEREKNALMKKKTESETKFLKIEDLKNGMKRVGLKGRILAISRPKIVQTRYNDNVMLATVTIKDETGTVKLTLWNGRASSLSVNNIIEIENASVRAYRGENQLRLGKYSRLRVIEDHDPRALIVCE